MTKKTSLMHLALGSFLALGMSAAALAQSSNGEIRGSVVDPSGALIQHAQVTVTDAAGRTLTFESDEAGAFDVANLGAGSYSISVNATGFTPALTSVDVAQDKAAEENIKLGISVNQEIEVSADEK